MKTLTEYILEYKMSDEMCIYKGTQKVTPARYAYDKESYDEFVDFYQKNKDKHVVQLCHLNNGKWQTLVGPGMIDSIKPNTNEYYTQGNIKLTYQELVDKLEDGKYILILLNNS